MYSVHIITDGSILYSDQVMWWTIYRVHIITDGSILYSDQVMWWMIYRVCILLQMEAYCTVIKSCGG